MRLVDADAMIDKYGEWYTEEGTEEGYIGTVKGIVDSMPTIEPARKKGKWILVTDGNGQHYVCDHCGQWRYHQGQKFCSECGLKMEEGDWDAERTS